ncbi:MAG TPA: divergent polysaccharide deacetylase family protein [Rhizomicrobium sp.]|nr:divergent polysaccharide deacetylase family protein [Rhizomicrobium sp.]
MAASSMIGQPPRRGAFVLALAWAFVVVGLASIAVAVSVFGDRNGGDVVATVPIQIRKIAKAAPPPPPPPPVIDIVETPRGGIVTATLSPEELALIAHPPAQAPAPPPSSQPPAAPPGATVPPAAPVAPPPVVPPPLVSGLNIANPALIEKTPQGPLPRIADNGLPPMRAYAVPVASDNRPKIAIVIGGLGISARATEYAIDNLPGPVTLAFAPYANDVQRWVSAARMKGHEVLLEVPMEPYDFPDSDPGQYTLRTGVGEDTNTKKLVWSLTRFTGYVGVTNLLGGRMLTDANALEPMLAYLSRRGLLFYDNGTSQHSVAGDVASRVGTPFGQASLTIDSIQAAMEIDHRLSDLETEARAKGSAVGSGFLYPVTVDRVNVWARGLSGRGLVLAPISALVSAPKKQ